MSGVDKPVPRDPFPGYSGEDPLKKGRLRALKDVPPSHAISQVRVELTEPEEETRDLLLQIETMLLGAISLDLDSFRRTVLDIRQSVQPQYFDVNRLLRLAILRGRLSLARQLIEEHEASVLVPDALGRLANFYLAIQDDFDLASYITSHASPHAKISHCDASGKTALWYAIRWGAQETTRVLLAHGARISYDTVDFAPRKDRRGVRRALGFSRLAQLYPERAFDIMQYSTVRDILSSDLSTLSYSEQRLHWLSERTDSKMSVSWVHYPDTHCDALYEAIKALQRLFDRSHPLCQLNLTAHFVESFKDPSTQPDDRDLIYRDPCYYSVERPIPNGSTSKSVWEKGEEQALLLSTLVFPFLVLESMVKHEARRKQQLDLNNVISVEEPRTWGLFERHNHIERTLDEAYYPGLSRQVLSRQNQHQVVSREFTLHRDLPVIPPILMVPQLWIWKFDRWVISASGLSKDCRSLFKPGHWESAILKRNPHIDTFSPKRQIGLVVVEHIERFGQRRSNGGYPPPLQIFESGVARILSDVVEYMGPAGSSKPDIQKEREFLNHISDIQGELAMIRDVLRQQEEVLGDMINDPPKDYVPPTNRDPRATYDPWDYVVDSMKTLDNYVRLTKKISADAARIEKNIQDELNLKRTFATMEDARTSLLLGIAVIGFTVVTVIFAPLAFMTALFALPIVNLEKSKVTIKSGTSSEEKTVFTTSYVGKWFVTAELVSLGLTGAIVVASLWWLGSLGKKKERPNVGTPRKSQKDPSNV